jgi:dTMP kinase
LHKGEIVLCDRFSDSSLAYQGAYGLISRAEILSLIAFATKGLKPDLTIYLDIDPIIGIERAKRSSFDRMEQKQIAFHQKVRDNFQQLARSEPDRFFEVDATMSPAEVFSLVYTHIKNRFL